MVLKISNSDGSSGRYLKGSVYISKLKREGSTLAIESACHVASLPNNPTELTARARATAIHGKRAYVAAVRSVGGAAFRSALVHGAAHYRQPSCHPRAPASNAKPSSTGGAWPRTVEPATGHRGLCWSTT